MSLYTSSARLAWPVHQDKTNRHIIFALRRVSVQGSLPIRRGNSVQSIAHISADIIIPVLVQRQSAAGVLDEEVEHADLVVAKLGQLRDDMVGDEVRAARAGGEREGLLEPGHFCRSTVG